MLPAIKHVASDTFVFQQDSAPSHHARTPVNSYSKKRRTSLVLISGQHADGQHFEYLLRARVTNKSYG